MSENLVRISMNNFHTQLPHRNGNKLRHVSPYYIIMVVFRLISVLYGSACMPSKVALTRCTCKMRFCIPVVHQPICIDIDIISDERVACSKQAVHHVQCTK